MSSKLIEKAFEEIESNINSDDLNFFQENLVDKLKSHDDSIAKYLKRVFELFEKYPKACWGEQGVIVHYLESLDNCLFENELIASIERCPVDHTLWMLNRLCNSKHTKEEINKYCNIFKDVVEQKNLDSNVVSSAEHFFNYQNKRLNQIYNENSSSDLSSKNMNNLFDVLSFIKIKPKK